MPVLDPERAMPRSALRYRPIAVTDQTQPGHLVTRPRRHAPDDLEGEREQFSRSNVPVQHVPTRRRFHPLFWVGLILFVTVLLWVGISQAVTWGTNELDTLRYGTTRTFQMDVLLGNGDSQAHPSHLLALNLHGEIILEVFPSGDVTHVQSYILTTLTGPGSDQAVVTVQLFDPNHTGKPDLIVHVGAMESLLINDQGSFRPPTPLERQTLLPLLQQENQ